MPRVYDQNNNLLGILEKAINVGYKQVYNGLWTATFTLPADDPKNEYCKPFNYVEIFDEQRRIELFRIMPSTLTRMGKRGFIVYECEHVITTLLDNVLFKFHQIGNIGVFTHEVINYVLGFQSVRNWTLGRCDFRHQFLYKWESENLLAALFSAPRPFADEWHFTYDTTVYPWIINLERAETEISCEIRHGKNMLGIERQIDPTNLVTRLIPLGYGEGENQLTIESVNGGRNYIEADTIDVWGPKETIWTDRRFEDANNILATAQAMLERLKNPWICYTVSSIDLFKRTMQDFDQFKEGRMVRVIDKVDDIDVDTRIVEIEKPDVTKADITVTIENKNRNVAGSIAALQERARINDTYAQGSETLLTIPFSDNAEARFPAIFEFYVPPNMVNVNEAILRIQLLPFRAFSRAVRGGGGTTQSTTSGGGTTETTTSGGGETATSSAVTLLPANMQVEDDGGVGAANHNHGIARGTPWVMGITVTRDSTGVITDVAPQYHGWSWTPSGAHKHEPHSHNVTIHPHSHNVTVPAHSHNVTVPDHTHEIEFGIFQGSAAQSISIRVDNNLIPVLSDLNNIDLIPFLRKDGGGRIVRGAWHRLEIVPDRLTRISAQIFFNIFTNSRGGGNF